MSKGNATNTMANKLRKLKKHFNRYGHGHTATYNDEQALKRFKELGGNSSMLKYSK